MVAVVVAPGISRCRRELSEEPVSASLEVPIRPGWAATERPRMDLPFVPVEPHWEYREVVREAGIDLLSEAELNALGSERWELIGIVPVGDRVHFYFKRERRPHP